MDKPQPSTARRFLTGWRLGWTTIVLLGATLIGVVKYPELLKPLIRSGVPLGAVANLPVVGDAINAAASPEMSVQDLNRRINRHDSTFLLVDVRSPQEFQKAHIPGAVFVPITDIEAGAGIETIKARLHGRQLITYCHSGTRSHKAIALLRKAGIEGTNLTGGIREWKLKIDPAMPEP